VVLLAAVDSMAQSGFQGDYLYNPEAKATLDSAQTGLVVLHTSPAIDSLVVARKRMSEEGGVYSGYRIQVVSGSNLQAVKDVRGKFLDAFPDMSVKIVLESPNFKLRAGNYLDRIDAFRDLQQIVVQFQGAFIVKDLIDIVDL
jgi:hypothetical protein